MSRMPPDGSSFRAPPVARAQPAPERTPLTWAQRLALGATIAVAVLGSAQVQAQAVSPYAVFGVPGAVFGVSYPASPGLGLRADIGGIDRIERTISREGVDYDAKVQFTRIGLFADWFALAGSFRLTGGFTFNDMRADLSLAGDGRSVNLGGTTYTLGPDDRFDGRVEMPAWTPYLGIGWGHHAANTGWGFVADVGASFGRPKVSGRASGPIVSTQPQIQQDVERELQEFRDGISGVRFFPQISLGVNYRF
jgi:hypothetical protein